jgi:hypothetical protein
MKEKQERLQKERDRLAALKKENQGLLAIEYNNGSNEDSRNGSKIQGGSRSMSHGRKPLYLEWEEKFKKEVLELEEEKRKKIL